MKRFWFWGALLAIIASWTINITNYEAKFLNKPIVLKHYIERPMDQTHLFKIYYVTNKNNPAILQTIEVGGQSIPNVSSSNDMWLYGNNNSIYNSPNIVQEFNQHLLLEAEFDPSMLHFEGEEVKPYLGTNVFLQFSDGTVGHFDIGEIRITPSIPTQNPKLNGISTGGTSDGLHSSIYSAEEKLIMNEFIVPEYIAKDVQVKVQYEGEKARVPDPIYQADVMPHWSDINHPLAKDVKWPIELALQGSVGVYIQIESTNNKAIDALVPWEGQTADGQPFKSFFPLLHIPQLTDEDLKNLMENEVNDGK